MINLINKLLSFFHLKLVSTKLDTSLVEATVKFMNQNPEFISNSLGLGDPLLSYVGDIDYVQEKIKGEVPQVSGETYYRGRGNYYFNSKKEEFFLEEIEAKLKND